MAVILFLLIISSSLPLLAAFKGNRKTTLLFTALWAFFAWMAWWLVFSLEVELIKPAPIPLRYLAVAMTGCASVTVLGARRPGAMAWNFVVGGLLLIMEFLWFEAEIAKEDRILRWILIILLASTVAIGVLNYLPTRLAPAALMLALGCGLEILMLMGSAPLQAKLEAARPIGRLALASVPWIGFARMRWRPVPQSEFDQVWLDFRDRFGLVWAQRLREQFNYSAAHAGWPVVLRWQGLRLTPGIRPPDPQEQEAMLDNLRALMKRFAAP